MGGMGDGDMENHNMKSKNLRGLVRIKKAKGLVCHIYIEVRVSA